MKQDGYDPNLIPPPPQPHGPSSYAHLGRAEKQADQRQSRRRPAATIHIYETRSGSPSARSADSDEEVHTAALNESIPKGFMNPKALHRREHHHPADGEDPRLHDDTGAMKKRVRGPA
jgi:hypothetical protein